MKNKSYALMAIASMMLFGSQCTDRNKKDHTHGDPHEGATSIEEEGTFSRSHEEPNDGLIHPGASTNRESFISIFPIEINYLVPDEIKLAWGPTYQSLGMTSLFAPDTRHIAIRAFYSNSDHWSVVFSLIQNEGQIPEIEVWRRRILPDDDPDLSVVNRDTWEFTSIPIDAQHVQEALDILSRVDFWSLNFQSDHFMRLGGASFLVEASVHGVYYHIVEGRSMFRGRLWDMIDWFFDQTELDGNWEIRGDEAPRE